MSSLPTTLGKYQIIREIARSNDIVFEAYDPLMNRRVALKELAIPGGSTGTQKGDRIKRFLREAKAAGSLSHPNIMTVYEVGEENGRHFIAMEFLDGHTLRNEIDTHGNLPLDRAIEIAIEVCEALDFAHRSGVVHRDIKPDNIQLLSDGRVKITDFGIARLTFEPNITMDGQVFGTPSYMSPEQVVGKDIDARSDIFSLGIVLYEMIVGQKPFPGDSVVAITYAIMNKEPERPQNVNFVVWQLIAKALDKSPALRHSSARELHDDLVAARAGSASLVLDAPNPQQSFGAFAPPTGNPYMNPFQAPAPQPPFAYPYNPYQPGQQIGIQPGNQPGQTTVPPGFMLPLPNYYPPPPRQPLIKPETKRFLGRIFVVSLLLGALIGLVIVGVWSAGHVYERMRNEAHDKGIQGKFAAINQNLPLSERIEQYRTLMNQLRDPASVEEARSGLAELHVKNSEMILKRGDEPGAEDSLREAINADSSNPKWYESLGDFYTKVAARAPDTRSQRDRYREASLRYEEGLSYGLSNVALANKVADAAYRAAVLSLRDGDREGFDYDIDRAEASAKDPDLLSRVRALKQQGSGF